jgi:hypothetical protein
MSFPDPLAAALANTPSLAELFRLFLSGKHLNRIAEPVLWTELEKQQSAYDRLFTALGYDLRLDSRGFAWFHSAEASSNISKTSRQLALLFMVIFDAQANVGKPLQRFNDWLIDREWLTEVYKQQQEVLDAEGLGPDELMELINRACTLGFAKAEPTGWRLLPSVCRYLDHFEALAEAEQHARDETEELTDSAIGADDPDDEVMR